MKVNVKIDISDEDRDTLADVIDGATSSRLATRKDINAYLNGCLDATRNALVNVDGVAPTEELETKRLQDAGYDDSYIRGWLQVGRMINGGC